MVCCSVVQLKAKKAEQAGFVKERMLLERKVAKRRQQIDKKVPALLFVGAVAALDPYSYRSAVPPSKRPCHVVGHRHREAWASAVACRALKTWR